MELWFCILLAALATQVRADDLSDFSNDLATDVGPLLVLFGEAMTRQYLSESTSFVDYFIFAMAPIGILTAIVSAIRVCGHSTLRAFIGRSQEGDGIIEAELCTSTSRDVCELLNKGGITRVLGRPCILELIHIPGEQDELHLFRHYLESHQPTSNSEWINTHMSASKAGCLFAPKPNPSLNVGIRKPSKWVFRFIAALGFLLQAGVLALAGVGVWVLEWNLSQSGSPASTNYAPIMFITGTVVMCGGMWSCAALIGQTTKEVRYCRKKGTPRSRLIWLQPGPQVIGDQSFDAFAYLENTESDPLSIWTSSRKDLDDRFEVYTFFAVTAVLIGYICQFIGLRGMKAWVSLAQLGITVIMSILRGLLRVQRLGRDANELRDMPDMVAGHELDWLAFQIAHGSLHGTRFWSFTGKRNNIDPQEGELPEHGENHNSLDLGKALFIRQRLAHLTGHSPSPVVGKELQQWELSQVKVRESAVMLASAICKVAETLFSKKATKDEITIHIQVVARDVDNRQSSKGEIDINMKPPKGRQTKWTVDSSQLEAVLGLSLWSLVSAKSLQKTDETGNRTSISQKIEWKRIVSGYLNFKELETQSSEQTNEIGLWFGPDARRLSPVVQIELRNGDALDLIDIQNNMYYSPRSNQYCGWNAVHNTLQPRVADSSANLDTNVSRTPTALELIAVATEESPPKILAQDLLLAILSPLVDVFTTGDTTVLESGGHVLLQNPVIITLSDILFDCGLASRFDALSCAISLLASKLHPEPESLLSDLIDSANTYRRNAEWDRAESLMQWACLHYPPPDGSEVEPSVPSSHLFVKALRTTGELYRLFCSQRSNKERLEFGIRGINWMIDKFKRLLTMDSEAKQILDDYESIAKLMKSGSSLGRLTLDSHNHAFIRRHPLVQAIQDHDKKISLWHLSFTATGDFKRHELQGALPLATRNGWAEIVSAILEMGGDINSKDEQGRTSLSYCAEYGHLSLLQHFIKLGASLHTKDNRGRTPMTWTVECKQTGVAEALLRAGCVNQSELESFRDFMLRWAIENGLVDIMQLLLKREDGLEPHDHVRDSELIRMAFEAGHTAVLDALFERHVNIESVETALQDALSTGKDEVVIFLLPYIHDPIAHRDLWTSVFMAVMAGHWTCVVLYLERCLATKLPGAGSKNTPLSNVTPQELALTLLFEMEGIPHSSGHSKSLIETWGTIGTMVKLVIDQGVSLFGDEYRTDSLLLAARNGAIDALKVLLENGANVDSEDIYQRTALSYACEMGGEDIVGILLQKNANVEKLDIRGRAPWMYIGLEEEGIQCLLLEAIANQTTREKSIRNGIGKFLVVGNIYIYRHYRLRI